MAIIESGLNPIAVSRARAKGMWQFMYRTALQYNLHINSFVDERLDPIKSAHAAAKYSRDAYTIFGDWALAISSYNCGSGNVNKAIRRAGSKDFWAIYPYLPRETRGYVPAFVGALYLLSYHKDYPNLQPDQINLPAHVDTFAIKKNLHFEQISANIGISVDLLRTLNPQYTHDIIPGNEREYILQLPYNYTAQFIDKQDSIYTYKDSVYFNPIVYNKLKEDKMISQSSKIYHKVRSGETLGGIATKYRVKLSSIYRWNGLSSKSIIRPGQKIVIYRNGAGPSSSSASKGTAQTTTSGGYTYYTVKKGDTLSGIAYKCGVSLNTILKLNGLSKTSKIYPGKKLKVKKN
jgi:membrane-bound lytic murein transglycosylase D